MYILYLIYILQKQNNLCNDVKLSLCTFRPQKKPVLDIADTSQVRLQLERIATLLDEGFKKSAKARKVILL